MDFKNDDIKNIDDLIKCNICYELLYNPMICKCGNIICLNCFNSINKNEIPSCPYCKININNYKKGIPPLLEELLNIYKKQCIYCGSIIFKTEYDNHIKKCSNEEIKCNNLNYGCNIIMKRSLLKDHFENCILNNNICKKILNDNNNLKKENDKFRNKYMFLLDEINIYKDDILEQKIKNNELKKKYEKLNDQYLELKEKNIYFDNKSYRLKLLD